ncbi:MAG: polyprotein [Apis hypovirus 1]|nr:MAG: polyprotein [Apis hypovirus 1]
MSQNMSPKMLRITSEDLSSSMADATATASTQPTSGMRGRFPKSLLAQVEDPDFDKECHCQCHIAPPALLRNPGQRQQMLSKVPKVGPIHDAAYGIPHECQLSDFERRRNHSFKRKLLLSQRGFEPSWKTGVVPAGFKEFQSPNSAPAGHFGKLSYCYQDVIIGTMRWKAAQVLGPECLLSDFKIFFNVAGQQKMKRRFLYRSEEGLWHVGVEKGVKGMDADAGANFAAQIDEVLDRNPYARIGFSTEGFGKSFPELPRTHPRGMQVTWPIIPTSAPSYSKVTQHALPVLRGGEGLGYLERRRTPWEKTKGDYHWLFERLDRKVRSRRVAKANEKLAPKVCFGVPSKFSPLRGLPGDQPLAWEGYGDLPRRERKTPRTNGVKNLKALNWMRICVERKRRFASIKSEKLTFHVVNGKMRPFRKGHCLAKLFPNNFNAALGVISKLLGKTFGEVSSDRFLLSAAYLNNWFYCPKTGFTLEYKNGSFAFWQNSSTGLSIIYDGKEIFHLGTLTDKMRAAIWKAAALSNLRNAQADGKSIGTTAVAGATSAIRCVNPWFTQQLIGFTVAAVCDGHKIFARGSDFSRPKEDDQELRITVRQYKRFWGEKQNKDLIFTMKGLAKVFFRKGNNEKWRFAIAKSVGLTLDAALIHFAKFLNDDSVPDVIERKLADRFIQPRVKIVEKPVFIEIPVNEKLYDEADAIVQKIRNSFSEGSDVVSEDTSTIPIPPPLPAKVAIPPASQSPVMADGNEWLLEIGPEGVSRRAIFRNTFPEDWWRRASEKAVKAMNQDLARQNQSAKHYDAQNWLVDPDLKFDIFAMNKEKKRPLLHSGPSTHDLLAEKIKEFKPSQLKKTTLGNDPRLTIEKQRGISLGNVVQSSRDVKSRRKQRRQNKEREFSDSELEDFVKELDASPAQFKKSRGSEDADIEENPGPTSGNEDSFTVNHPTPSDLKKNRRRTQVSNSISLVSNRQSLAFTDRGSPIEKMMVTSPTPVTPISFQDEFDLSRDSTKHDIETNPGPEEETRGRSETLKPRSGRSRSMSARAVDAVTGVFSSKPLDSLEEAEKRREKTKKEEKKKNKKDKNAFGFSSLVEVRIHVPAQKHWMHDEYDYHHVVGHLPKNKQWVLYEPCWSDRQYLMNTLQRSLDSVFFAGKEFSKHRVAKTVNLMNKFFEKTLLNEGFDFRSLSALAHVVKSTYGCPKDDNGHAFELVPGTNEIVYHFTSKPNENIRNKLIWSIGKTTCFHGAAADDDDDDGTSTVVPPRPSRTNSFIQTAKRVFGLRTQTDLEFVRYEFGFNTDVQVALSNPKDKHWMYQKYETHHIIGHLPGNKAWKLYKPSSFERSMMLNTCQRSLDSVFFANSSFNYQAVRVLMMTIDRFCQRTLLNEGFDFRSLSALAHVFKSFYACPTDGNGYAVELEPETNAVVFHFTSKPTEDIKNKLIWSIGDATCFHGGSNDTTYEVIRKMGYYKWNQLSVLSIDYCKDFQRFYQDELNTLPAEDKWEFTDEGLPSVVTFNELQSVLNEVTKKAYETTRFIDKRVVSTIGYLIKRRIGCPTNSSFSFAIRFSDVDVEAEFLVDKKPDQNRKGKLYLFLEDRWVVHCGTERRLITQRDSFLSQSILVQEKDKNCLNFKIPFHLRAKDSHHYVMRGPVFFDTKISPAARQKMIDDRVKTRGIKNIGKYKNKQKYSRMDEYLDNNYGLSLAVHMKIFLEMTCERGWNFSELMEQLCKLKEGVGCPTDNSTYFIHFHSNSTRVVVGEYDESAERPPNHTFVTMDGIQLCHFGTSYIENLKMDMEKEKKTSDAASSEIGPTDHMGWLLPNSFCVTPMTDDELAATDTMTVDAHFRRGNRIYDDKMMVWSDDPTDYLTIPEWLRTRQERIELDESERPCTIHCQPDCKFRPLPGSKNSQMTTKELCWLEAEQMVTKMEKEASLAEHAKFHRRYQAMYGQPMPMPVYDMKVNLPFIYLYLRVWYFFMSFKVMIVSNLWPDVEDNSNPDHPDNDKPNEEKLLIAEYGTHGDIIPLRYYSNLARHYGIPVDERIYNKMNNDDLESLRIGDFIRFMPKQLHMATYSELEYKAAFIPHIEVDGTDHSYCLNPSNRFVNDTKFVDDWSKVSYLNFLPAVFATLTTKVVDHTWRIGSITDSTLPRSCDGKTLLKQKQNRKTGRIGWVSGSADKSVIPKEIRDRYEEIPKGDHSELFRNYDVVHCHGGAGTVQVIVACGATPVIHDPTLDRDYHTLPTAKDFHQPTIGPFMGWLVSRGFKPRVNLFVRVMWYLMYIWSIKMNIIYKTTRTLLKAYVIAEYLRNHWGMFLILFFTVPTIFWRAMYKTKHVSSIIRAVAAGLWKFPLFCLLQSKFSFVITCWVSKTLFWRLLQDWSNAIERNTEIIFEPVSRQGITFPFPFGHYCVRDISTGLIYEGHFTTNSQTLGSMFKFREIARDPKPGYRTFPAPFSVHQAKKMVLLNNEPAAYGPHHHCATYIAKLVGNKSFAWSIFIAGVCGLIGFALSPPEMLRWVMNKFYPGVKIQENPFYLSLGFAAGIEQIPFEIEEEVETIHDPYLEATPVDELPAIDFSKQESLDGFLNEIAVIQNSVKCSEEGKHLEEDELQEVSERLFVEKINEVKFPKDSMITTENIPAYVKHTWAEIVDKLHYSLSKISNVRMVRAFVIWLKQISYNIYDFIFPILDMLGHLGNVLLHQSRSSFIILFENVCHFLDHVWGIEKSNRVKSAWGLTGLHRTGMLGAKALLAANIQYAEYSGRNDFESDYKRFVDQAKHLAEIYNAKGRSKIGGPQRRKVGYSRPLMSIQESQLLGLAEDEVTRDREYQERIDSYIHYGASQGADGVFLAEKRPELIAKSQHRYEPKYPELSSDDRQFAKDIALAFFKKFPDTFENADILPPKAVHNYIKKKYSPGTPFINGKSFKSRQAMFDAGFDKVMQKRAIKMLETGKYDPQFYHAFVKSQVVNIKNCLTFEEGGKNKDVRTVVSQDLFSYYIDQCVQIERNKRITWDTYGAGIGMPLNQTMATVFEKVYNAQQERGGRYIIADATAFDSYCKPFLFEVNACLWELGFKDHPSGNGKNIASVVRASTDARQNAWIIGVTEPEYDSLTVCIPQKHIRKEVESKNYKNLLPLAELIDFGKFNKLNEKGKISYVQNVKVPDGKTIITWDPKFMPKRSNWMGNYVTGNTSDVAKKFFDTHTLTYEPNNIYSLVEDVKAVSNSNYKLLSNVHPKNRGGSTGGSDTSNINTVTFKAGIVAAWCLTMGRKPDEFFEYNTLYDTSDDTIWQTGGVHGLNTVNDIEKFRHYCSEMGIHLEMETTKDIRKVEYLSKFVRPPSKDDSEALSKWRHQKIAYINQSRKARGLPIAETHDQLNNPKFLVTTNPSAILLRRTAFRYYQGSATKWRYTSVERGSGHAYNVAFIPDLYEKFALEWCSDVNQLLAHHKIHRKYEIRNGQFGLQEVQQIDPRAAQQALSPRQQAFITWLKGNMMPSYYKVIDVHMNVAKIDPEHHAKFLRKLEKGWRGWEQLTREGVDWLYSLTDQIPDEWSKKYQPTVEMLYAENPFYTYNMWTEKFVALSILAEKSEDEFTFGDLSQALQEGPYANACDLNHFWDKWQQVEFRKELLNENIYKIQGMVFCITGLYMMTTLAEKIIMASPFGVFYKLFLWSFIGLNKVYGILNTMYWHSTAKSSREISRIMPRDPYAVSKQFCAFVADLLPSEIGYIFTPLIVALSFLPPCLESIGKTWYVAGKVKAVEKKTGSAENPWRIYASDFVDKARSSPTGAVYNTAGTGSGKSSWFIDALVEIMPEKKINRIWLLEPRKILRKEATMPNNQFQKLEKGKTLQRSAKAVVLTYGHFLSRLDQVDLNNDIVLLDEFHEVQGKMLRSLEEAKCPKILMSATPVDIPQLSGTPTIHPNMKRRHPITVVKYPDDMSIIDAFMLAWNKHPEDIKRSLVIVPTHKEVQKTILALNYLKIGVPVSPLSARDRLVPQEGIIVATPYVQTGLDINPPVNIVIDSGKDIKFHMGKMVMDKTDSGRMTHPWTDSNVNQQRIGRSGRQKAGIVYQPESAGTGEQAVVYPEPNDFTSQIVSEYFKIPQLTSLPYSVNSLMPYLRLNVTKLKTRQVQKSVAFIHALSMSGIRQQQWEDFYTKKLMQKNLGEDYEWLERVYNHSSWSHVPLLDWATANYWLHLPRTAEYGIGGKENWSLPIRAVDGRWKPWEAVSNEDVHYTEITQKQATSHFMKTTKALTNLKSAIMLSAKQYSSDATYLDKMVALTA